MKILQVNVVYKTGSTGKITYDLHMGLLDEGIESVVCYGRGSLVKEPGVYKTCPEWYSKLNNAWSRVTGVTYGGCFFSTNRLIQIIKKEQPDIVHLQCINGYFVNIYRLVTWLKNNHIKTVLTLHAEFMYTANCGHSLECDRWRTGCGSCPHLRKETKSLFIDGTARSWKRMKVAFDGFNELKVVSVSPWLMGRAKESPILAGHDHTVIFNGLDTSVFHPYDTVEMRNAYSGKKIVFHATPGFSTDRSHIKGGWYICELAERLPDVQFIIAGPYLEGISVPYNVQLLGKITDQELLARYYSMADLTLLTSKKETFSMVTAESLCCGTPVVGFKAGGPEQIALAEYSDFVENGDLKALQERVEQWLHRKKNTQIGSLAAERYSASGMVAQYMESYCSLQEE